MVPRATTLAGRPRAGRDVWRLNPDVVPRWRRIDNGVDPPPLKPLPHKDLYKGSKVQHEVLKEHLYKEGKISEDDVARLCKDAIGVFRSEPNIIKLEGNLNIVGDIHGQYYDLMKVFEVRARCRSARSALHGAAEEMRRALAVGRRSAANSRTCRTSSLGTTWTAERSPARWCSTCSPSR